MSLIDSIKKKYPQTPISVMRQAIFDHQSGGTDFTRNKTLIQSALRQSGYDALADKMAQCSPSNRCKSPYCDSCQRSLFGRQRRKSDEFLWHPYRHDETKARENLFFVTILHELIPFDLPDDTLIRFPLTKVKTAIAEARTHLKAIRRTFKDRINLIGAFELEVVSGLLVCLHPVKGQVLAEMSGSQIELQDKFILLHSHFVVDLSEFPPDPLSGDLAVDQFKARLKKSWPAKKQIDVSPLYLKKPVHESLNRLADYPLKFPIKYYYRWNGAFEENQIDLDGKKQNLARNHEMDVMAQMISGVSELGMNALYIRLGVSKASIDKSKKRDAKADAFFRKVGPPRDLD
tara:strand:- start:5514 stop:6551 length:1038 start_codon:yes stop_codon:yes gene_type:complete